MHQCQLLLLLRRRRGVQWSSMSLKDILILALLLAFRALGCACSAACRLVQLKPQVSHVLTAVVLVHGGELARAGAVRECPAASRRAAARRAPRLHAGCQALQLVSRSQWHQAVGGDVAEL